MAEEAKWYVVHTYSGYENKVATSIENAVDNRNLRHLIPEVRLPMERVTEIKDNKTVEVERKLFPSYVLIKMIMTDDSWYVVRNIRGVTGFVGPGSKPVPLTDEEVERFQVEISPEDAQDGKDAAVFEVTEVVLSYEIGDSVRIRSGPMENFIGVVDSIDKKNGTAKIIVSMMGKETAVDLAFSLVEPVI